MDAGRNCGDKEEQRSIQTQSNSIQEKRHRKTRIRFPPPFSGKSLAFFSYRHDWLFCSPQKLSRMHACMHVFTVHIYVEIDGYTYMYTGIYLQGEIQNREAGEEEQEAGRVLKKDLPYLINRHIDGYSPNCTLEDADFRIDDGGLS